MSIETTRWRIDPTRSTIEFRIKMLWGLTTVTGRFAEYHGTLGLAGEPAIELTIDTASIDTKNEKRDTHLRSPDFFGADLHPYMRFVSDRATLDGERLSIEGELRARGEAMPLTLEATLRPVGDELEIEASTDTDRRRLGVDGWSRFGLVSTSTRMTVHGRLVPDAN
jgi:polyisoprenoid-binding protein YceI